MGPKTSETTRPEMDEMTVLIYDQKRKRVCQNRLTVKEGLLCTSRSNRPFKKSGRTRVLKESDLRK